MTYIYEEFKRKFQAYNCQRCSELCSQRTNIVVDRGNPHTKILVIGEAPGQDEDLSGRAFVGRAGKLLDSMFTSIGLDTNQDLLIVNLVKCRPPKNRIPTPEEISNCSTFLKWQFNSVNPKVVILVGATAVKVMLKSPDLKITQVAGQFFGLLDYPCIHFFILYHPAYLLRNPNMKQSTWAHLKTLKNFLDNESILCYNKVGL